MSYFTDKKKKKKKMFKDSFNAQKCCVVLQRLNSLTQCVQDYVVTSCEGYCRRPRESSFLGAGSEPYCSSSGWCGRVCGRSAGRRFSSTRWSPHWWSRCSLGPGPARRPACASSPASLSLSQKETSAVMKPSLLTGESLLSSDWDLNVHLFSGMSPAWTLSEVQVFQ